MLNVNQITSQLAKLPDQSLQRYAMMHKDDPYVLSLAVAESNRRKQLRAGAQMQAPQQPKVAEQAIQGMAAPMPETVGIGQLPAGNMDFAEGGIVAFGEGGDVPRYQYGGLMAGTEYGIPGMTQSTLLQDALAKLNEGRELSGQEKALLFASKPLTAAADVAVAPINLLRRFVRNPLDTSPLPSMTPVSDARARALGLDQAQAQTQTPTPSGQNTPSAPVDLGPVPGSKDTDVMGGMPTSVAPRQTPPPQIKPPTSPTGQGFDGSIEGLQKLYGSLTSGPLVDPFAKERGELGEARTKGAEQRLSDFDKDIAKLGELGAKTEERLKKRGEKIEASEKQNLGLALLQAGSAMMAGKSKYALANIGAGVGVGAEQFAKGLDKIDSAKERLDDAFDRLEQSRRSEQMLTASERRRLQGDVYNAFVESKKDTISGLSDALGLKHKQGAAVFDGGLKLRIAQMEQEGRIGYAERAGNLGLFRALGDGDVKKGFDIYMSSQAESKGLAGLVQNFAKNPTALALLKQTDPELANLIQMQMRSLALQPTATPTGPVRP